MLIFKNSKTPKSSFSNNFRILQRDLIPISKINLNQNSTVFSRFLQTSTSINNKVLLGASFWHCSLSPPHTYPTLRASQSKICTCLKNNLKSKTLKYTAGFTIVVVGSNQGYIVVSILIDLHDFWTYENREFSVLPETPESSLQHSAAYGPDLEDAQTKIWSQGIPYICTVFLCFNHSLLFVNFQNVIWS